MPTPNLAEFQRRIQALEAQVNKLKAAPVSSAKETAAQAVAAANAAVAANKVNFANLVGATKPAANATNGATTGVNLVSGVTSAVLADSDIVTSQGTAALIAGQGALAVQSVVSLSGISGLNIQTTASLVTIEAYDLTLWSGDNTLVILAPSLTVAIGTVGQGGVAPSAVANKLYSLQVWYNPTTQTAFAIGIGVGSSGWSPPSGYTYSAYIGSVYINGTGNFQLQSQYGNQVFFNPPLSMPLSAETSYTELVLTGVPAQAVSAVLDVNGTIVTMPMLTLQTIWYTSGASATLNILGYNLNL